MGKRKEGGLSELAQGLLAEMEEPPLIKKKKTEDVLNNNT